VSALAATATSERGFASELMQLDVVLDLVESNTVKKLLFEVQNHNFCTVLRVLSVAALPSLEVHIVYAALGHNAIRVLRRLKSPATQLKPKDKF
jgi:hypothetical protein